MSGRLAGYLGKVNGTIALTYDDGPDPEWTPRILDLLGRAGARATFFVDARRALVQRDLVRTIVARGHEVAFHCFEHIRHSERDARELYAELDLGLGLLDLVGVKPRAWRAPWGVETEATRDLAATHDLRLWGWNVDTHDWRGDPAARMFAALKAQGGLRDGDVILMHDALGPGARRDDCDETVALTELLLDAADRAGLATASVSACDRVLA
ncbi:MAG: peptidoglycan-N-acetylglucosamine deacetylase [Solirubrobacterales bacterium]|nr:peptidoglycan-N-acetylglucosamine deacetylase [Solirubrobacterales bacterium]